MKANETPEKIYIQSFNASEEDAKFDKSKMFFDDVWTEEPEPGQENIEYIRKDTFIEKACEFIKNHHHEFSFWNTKEYELGFTTEKFIEEFKKAMKNETYS